MNWKHLAQISLELKNMVGGFTLYSHQQAVANLYEVCDNLKKVSAWYFDVENIPALLAYRKAVETEEPIPVLDKMFSRARNDIRKNLRAVLNDPKIIATAVDV